MVVDASTKSCFVYSVVCLLVVSRIRMGVCASAPVIYLCICFGDDIFGWHSNLGILNISLQTEAAEIINKLFWTEASDI